MKNKRKDIKVVVALFLVFCNTFLISCGKQGASSDTTSNSVMKPYIEFFGISDAVSLTNSVVMDFWNGKNSADVIYKQCSSQFKLYSSKYVSVNWSVYDIPSDVVIEKQVFTLSLEGNVEIMEELSWSKRDYELHNLFVDSEYVCKIEVYFSNGEILSKEHVIKTQPGPRIVMADGVYGMRDFGGVKTAQGVRLKQGMVFRGSELDGMKDDHYKISEEGKKIFLNDFKIRSEIDLRGSDSQGQNVLGESVTHNKYTIYAYSDCLIEASHEGLKNLFSYLSKPEHYPVYVHCSYGKDRTGTVIYLLQLLTGVSEADAYREWELSALLDGVHFYEGMDEFIEEFKGLPGETMQEKTEKYLLSLGVTESEIENIKNILLEPPIQ